MAAIREDLAAINVRHDVFFSERSLSENDLVGRTIKELRELGEVYEGRLPPPKGAPIEDWEDREQTCFAQPISATMSTVRWSNPTVATLISLPTSPITRTSSIAGSAG